ncbi:MAG: ABC transporter permease [Anaerolineaceae bacterium]|nr:ABC transporter permease [Anaerolineaceae bacterium]
MVNLHCQQENGGLLLENLLGILTHAWEYGLSHASEFEQALGDHLVLVGTALGISILLCIPLGIWTARSRLASLTIMNLINALRVIPSLAVLFLLIPILGLNTTSATVALTVLAMPPILINTDAAFRNLDPAVIEAAQGMGMTAGQVLRRIEFPLALPVILTGIRTAAVEIISSATLAAFVGSGGLGIYITRGFALYDYGILMLGAAPVALLTLIAETILALLQRLFQPPA